MNFEKTVLYRFSMPYALGTLHQGGQPCVVAATEDHGPIVVSRPPFDHAEVLVDGPGGCMSLVGDPALPHRLYAIMGCFLGYQFHGGAVYRVDTGPQGVETRKLAELPFAHRMEVVERSGKRFMLLANLAASKDTPDDWSRPGTVYALPLDAPGTESAKTLEKRPVLEGLHKNHGFLKTTLQGRPTVLISGTEGVFALDLAASGDDWTFERLMTHEVSEMAVCDLDGDGRDELITIEPFHGSQLCVYHSSSSGWQKVWTAELNYGHCVLAQGWAGRPSLLVSNRAGAKELLLFRFEPEPSGRFPVPQRHVVEAGVGAANMLFWPSADRDLLFATNQVQGELVRYELRP